MHGRGIFYWPDKRRYEGEWKDDKQHWHNIVCKRIFIFIILKLNKIFNTIKSSWLKETEVVTIRIRAHLALSK